MASDSNNIKIIFLADTHLGFDYPIRPRTTRRRRGDDFFANYYKIIDHAKSHADLLIHGGDMFYKSRVHEKIVDMAYEPLLEVAESGVPIFIVPGNHERSQLPTSLLLNHKNIFVFDVPKTISLHLNGLDVALSGFPFERGDIRRSILDVLKKTGYEQHQADVKLLCLHQAIEGATVGPSNFTFRYGKDTITRADIPIDFDAILSGHIHRFQILSKDNDAGKSIPIIYPGSIERTAFAEKMDDKGFVELTCTQNGVEQIEFIKLPARPMYDLNIDRADSLESIKTIIKSAVSEFDADAVVRITLEENIDATIRRHVTSSMLRQIVPATMNVQMTAEYQFSFRAKSVAGSTETKRRLAARIRKEAPAATGVYLFKDENINVIYIGKSVNLKQRMASYFYNSNPVETRIRQMVFSIRDFSFIETETELLALLLEDALIKKHLPQYNVKQKEFNDYRYLLLTNDNYPTLKIIAHDDTLNGGEIFGPFKDEYFVRDLLDVIYRRLNLRQCQEREPVLKSINYELGLCTGPCRNKINTHEYNAIVTRVRDFLSGDVDYAIDLLDHAMQKASSSLEFEQAASLKRQRDFCGTFGQRQHFLYNFKTSKLSLQSSGKANEYYTFLRGRLIAAKIDRQTISHEFRNINDSETDARFVLDRGNIVYNWLKKERNVITCWE